MSYYPLSQIKTNLYTQGTEYQTPDGNEYTGFYYKVSTGKLYTGKTPQNPPNLLLTLQPQQEENNEDILLSRTIQKSQVIPSHKEGDPDPNINPIYQPTLYLASEYNSLIDPPSSKSIPYTLLNTPTSKDYTIGEFRRYFCKRANNIIYIEIDKQQYDFLINRDSNWYWEMYSPFFIPWNISGDVNQVETTNRNIVKLTSFRKNLPKLGDYLKFNYLKYYK